ncbi:MAG: hypothetical protein A3H72_01220 [Candidatus Doudnabacteria bacterium RIFCSPLOWO2_02_FULL_48_8]|uniref:Uncharacterized protein n=1 Tax=Candidatus Doudnabacteria bacterium RIFCSPHIGHO2_01_FULL_46_24 TaxID=1817825 RepID=A0A1F5NUV4_9BACT|nr:MAG: hypothetical protein A2720_02770 [Candidatus Doudnabacteria bacterium RIFCSPHIGHO2_01_FULL_46_24]OGE95018.1 MAG: hypothetical protein A3H72_01220 [Candidatus Doudnabacteria bacterium RIFCSPLOWO2_02_FULL_48_8]OGE95942.1 MAG: hypothetical protein A3E98_00645 [Candidatus Doudnabacteria bacterium RIFCSPHIGHO2_12_FULL_48_11]
MENQQGVSQKNISNQPVPTLPPNKNWLSRHMVLGYVFLGLVFAGIVAGVFYWQYGWTFGNDCSRKEILAVNNDGETKKFYNSCLPPGWSPAAWFEDTNQLDSDASVGAGEAANWQTYLSPFYDFRFRFEYPSDWVDRTDEYGSKDKYLVLSTKESGFDTLKYAGELKDYYAWLKIPFGPVDVGTNMTQYSLSYCSNPKSLTISGAKALRCRGEIEAVSGFAANKAMEYLFIEKTTGVMLISMTIRGDLTQEQQDEYARVFDQIISTFMFVR